MADSAWEHLSRKMEYTYPHLTIEQEDDVLKGINYTRQQLENDKVQLRTWLNKQEHLPECRKKENDAFLVSFLVGCKGSLEKAKKKIDTYYSIRGHGDIFTERDTIDYAKSAENFQYFAMMPKPTPEGCIVNIIGLLVKEADKCIMLDGFKRMVLYHEWRLRQGSGISRGEINLADAKDFSAGHVMKLNPSLVKSYITWVLNACSLRMVKFVMFNTDPLLDTFANNVIRPLLSAKLRSRFVVTSDSDLSKHFEHMDLLPSTYGGKGMDKITMSQAYSSLLNAGVKDILPTLGETTDEFKRPKLHGYLENPHFGAFGSIKTIVTD